MTAPTKAKPRKRKAKRRVAPRQAIPLSREQRQQADHTRMLAYIASERARLEREAELDWRLERALAGTYDGPLLGELLEDGSGQ
jgi:hypothetical protein